MVSWLFRPSHETKMLGDYYDICIVEDDSDIREVLAEVLTEEGYHVLGVANGKEAVHVLSDSLKPPKLILLDLMMPVMSGWQFIAVQKQIPGLAQIPVVVVSADLDLPQKAYSMGAQGHLSKPIPIDDLLCIVRELCS